MVIERRTVVTAAAATIDAPATSSITVVRSLPAGMIEPPRLLANAIELSIHSCTKSMIREVRYIFPHQRGDGARGTSTPHFGSGAEEAKGEDCAVPAAVDMESILIIPTIQKSRIDTVRFGAEVEEEKDRCLELFVDFAKPLCMWLRDRGHWADYIDPCSGLPVLTPHCTRPYSEVAGFEHLLRYKTQNAGCCKILLHPRWGSSCYPATIFTTAPLEVYRQALDRTMASAGFCTKVAGAEMISDKKQ